MVAVVARRQAFSSGCPRAAQVAFIQELGPDIRKVADALACSTQTKERDSCTTKGEQFIKDSGGYRKVQLLAGTEDKHRRITGLEIGAISCIHFRYKGKEITKSVIQRRGTAALGGAWGGCRR